MKITDLEKFYKDNRDKIETLLSDSITYCDAPGHVDEDALLGETNFEAIAKDILKNFNDELTDLDFIIFKELLEDTACEWIYECPETYYE